MPANGDAWAATNGLVAPLLSVGPLRFRGSLLGRSSRLRPRRSRRDHDAPVGALEIDAVDATRSAAQPARPLVGEGHRPAIGDAGDRRPGVAFVGGVRRAAWPGGDDPAARALAFVAFVVVLVVVARVGQTEDRA